MKTKLSNFIHSDSLAVLILTLSLIITVVISLQSPSIKAITQHEIITQVNEESAADNLTPTTAQPQTDQIITESFKVVSANNGEYTAINTTDSSDKQVLHFASVDIEGNKDIKENDIVTGHYIEAGTEDIFTKVTTGEVSASTQCKLQSDNKTCVVESAL